MQNAAAVACTLPHIFSRKFSQSNPTTGFLVDCVYQEAQAEITPDLLVQVDQVFRTKFTEYPQTQSRFMLFVSINSIT